MNLEKIISDTLSKIELNVVLRRDTMQKLDHQLGALDQAQTDEEVAIMRQKLHSDSIATLRNEIATCDNREAAYQSQLRSLQAMMIPTPAPVIEPEPEPEEESEEEPEEEPIELTEDGPDPDELEELNNLD